MQFAQNIHVVSYIFIASDNRFRLDAKIGFANNLSEFIDKVAIEFKFGQTILQKCFQTYAIFKHQFRITAITLRKCFT